MKDRVDCHALDHVPSHMTLAMTTVGTAPLLQESEDKSIVDLEGVEGEGAGDGACGSYTALVMQWRR